MPRALHEIVKKLAGAQGGCHRWGCIRAGKSKGATRTKASNARVARGEFSIRASLVGRRRKIASDAEYRQV
jgi:hypothetical protein